MVVCRSGYKAGPAPPADPAQAPSMPHTRVSRRNSRLLIPQPPMCSRNPGRARPRTNQPLAQFAQTGHSMYHLSVSQSLPRASFLSREGFHPIAPRAWQRMTPLPTRSAFGAHRPNRNNDGRSGGVRTQRRRCEGSGHTLAWLRRVTAPCA